MARDKIRDWVRIELDDGENPEVLKRSLKAQGYDPGLVDEVMSGGGQSAAIPWKKALAVIILICSAFLAVNWINTPNKTDDRGTDGASRHNLDIVRGNPEPVTLNISFIKGVEKSLKEYGSYSIKSDLPEYRCYHLYIDRDSEGYYLGLEEIYSWRKSCIGNTVNDTRIRTPYVVNIAMVEPGATCICEESEVNIESSEIRNIDTGDVVINFKVNQPAVI